MQGGQPSASVLQKESLQGSRPALCGSLVASTHTYFSALPPCRRPPWPSLSPMLSSSWDGLRKRGLAPSPHTHRMCELPLRFAHQGLCQACRHLPSPGWMRSWDGRETSRFCPPMTAASTGSYHGNLRASWRGLKAEAGPEGWRRGWAPGSQPRVGAPLREKLSPDQR